MEQNTHVYTILEVNTIIQGVIRETFSDLIWVCGEVQDFKINPKYKHLFFTLSQKHPEADEVISKIKAVIFEEPRNYIFEKLRKIKPDFMLRDDLAVKVLCKVDAYARWGEYRLQIVDIDPMYTLGQLAQSRERIIESLKSRGLLEKNKALPFPAIPLHIALITSYGSAAYHDVISELKHSGYAFTVYCYDAHMQGNQVEKDIVRAVRYFQSKKDMIDVIVISRGGGSTADLSWFDNQKIAEAIAQSDLPVLTAIGHEINVTISDLVSYQTFKTPTKVAQYIVETVQSFEDALDTSEAFVIEKTRACLADARHALQTTLFQAQQVIHRYYARAKEHIRAQEVMIQQSVRQSLGRNRMTIEHLQGVCRETIKFRLDKERQLLRRWEDTLRLLDPQATLKRGYSITLYQGKAITRADRVKIGDSIQTVLSKGKISSKIEGYEKQADSGIRQPRSRSVKENGTSC